jgi:Asp-tRNA(Asn)/Glu-tRNA(Gln) amidotransferase A subunit family amidase
MSACDMADAIKRQELTSQEITETIIERIEKINPIINAYCTTAFDLAREMAKKADDVVKKGEKLGLLNGIPISIKDLIMTKGIRTTFGSRLYENFIPEEDSIAVKRLKIAGCVLLGKTNSPEFGLATVTQNPIFGESKNPWNRERTTGGSSGGSAAAVASGLGPLSIGTDLGGSVRIPSSLCGTYGLKPSFGRVPIYPTAIFLGETMDHYGPIVRYVKDAALMLDVIKGPDDNDRHSLPSQSINYSDHIKDKPKKLKIAFTFNLGNMKALDPEVKKIVFNSIEKFETYEWSTENIKMRIKKMQNTYTTLCMADLAYDLKFNLENWSEKIDPMLKMILKAAEMGINTPSINILKAENQRNKIFNEINQIFKNYDILITPTVTVPPFELGIMGPTQINGKKVTPRDINPYSYPFNMTGHPAASIPCGWSKEGLPIGMQIVGKRYDELTVLQVSQAFEEISPWQDIRPEFT